MPARHNIKMGEIILTDNPEEYCMVGLGSCLGIVVYDVKHQYFGISHTALPEIKRFLDKPNSGFDPTLPGKFTDVAIKIMVAKLKEKGLGEGHLRAKIVGGGQIFDNDIIRIGENNLQSARATLKEVGVRMESEFLAGKNGVSILNFNKDGKLVVKKEGTIFEI